MFKKCVKCQRSKEVAMFRRSSKSKDGYKPRCKDCLSTQDAEYRKKDSSKLIRKQYRESGKEKIWSDKHYANNKSKVLDRNKSWRLNNKDKIAEYEEKNKIRLLEKNRNYYANNSIKWVERRRERYHSDYEYKVKTLLSNSLRTALKRKNWSKSGSCVSKYLGVTVNEFKVHLESTFQDGMAWSNFGEWHIDHIIPLDLFCLSREACRYTAFNYKNMRALWAIDNIKKGNKYVRSN